MQPIRWSHCNDQEIRSDWKYWAVYTPSFTGVTRTILRKPDFIRWGSFANKRIFSHAIALFFSTVIKKKKKRISVVSWEILSHQSPRAGFYQIERCEFACVGRSWLSTVFDVKTMTQFSCSHDASYLCRVYSSPDSFTDKEAVKMAKVGAREQRLRQSDTGTGSHVWFGKNQDAKKETYIV